MKQELQNRCELFLENRPILTKVFSLSSSYIYPVAANMLASKNVSADREKLEACRKILAENTGFFSNFRGNGLLPILCMLALDADPQDRMVRACAIHAKLREEFSSSDYLPLVAMLLSEMASVSDADTYIRRGKEIFKHMKKEHPFLTGADDSIFAVLMAFTDKDDEQLIGEIEQVYEELKDDGFDKNSTHTVSMIFALTEGDYRDRCARLRTVFNGLMDGGRKYGKHYEIAALAGLVLLPVPTETLIEELLEVDEYLSEQKGYGFFGYDKKTRLMHAAMILTGFYGGSEGAEMGALTGTIALVAVEQAAIYAGIIAGATFAASSTSSN